MDGVWISDSFRDVDGGVVLSMQTVNVDSIADHEGITRAECAKHLREQVLKSEYNTGFILNRQSEKGFFVEFIITHVSPGSKAARIWAGEFGFGHANVQIQAIVFNAEGKRLIELTDSRNSSAGIGFRDMGRDLGPVLIRELIEQISGNLLQELALLLSANQHIAEEQF